MENKNIIKELSKPLSISDVDFRIQSINKGGFATILAYKDARVDMNRLDEVCNGLWQKKYHYIESEKMLFCSVGIKIDNEWIWREDLGVESYADKKKGQASDSFKRACFNWGIGRELYDYPTIHVKLNSNEFKVENNKAKQTFNLKLKDWKWNAVFNDGKILQLTAVDEKGNLRFDSLKQNLQKPAVKEPNQSAQNNPNQTKPWLNKKDRETGEITKEWNNVIDGINKGTVKNIEDIKKHYRLSIKTSNELGTLFNYDLQKTA